MSAIGTSSSCGREIRVLVEALLGVRVEQVGAGERIQTFFLVVGQCGGLPAGGPAQDPGAQAGAQVLRRDRAHEPVGDPGAAARLALLVGELLAKRDEHRRRAVG